MYSKKKYSKKKYSKKKYSKKKYSKKKYSKKKYSKKKYSKKKFDGGIGLTKKLYQASKFIPNSRTTLSGVRVPSTKFIPNSRSTLSGVRVPSTKFIPNSRTTLSGVRVPSSKFISNSRTTLSGVRVPSTKFIPNSRTTLSGVRVPSTKFIPNSRTTLSGVRVPSSKKKIGALLNDKQSIFNICCAPHNTFIVPNSVIKNKYIIPNLLTNFLKKFIEGKLLLEFDIDNLNINCDKLKIHHFGDSFIYDITEIRNNDVLYIFTIDDKIKKMNPLRYKSDDKYCMDNAINLFIYNKINIYNTINPDKKNINFKIRIKKSKTKKSKTKKSKTKKSKTEKSKTQEESTEESDENSDEEESDENSDEEESDEESTEEATEDELHEEDKSKSHSINTLDSIISKLFDINTTTPTLDKYQTIEETDTMNITSLSVCKNINKVVEKLNFSLKNNNFIKTYWQYLGRCYSDTFSIDCILKNLESQSQPEITYFPSFNLWSVKPKDIYIYTLLIDTSNNYSSLPFKLTSKECIFKNQKIQNLNTNITIQIHNTNPSSSNKFVVYFYNHIKDSAICKFKKTKLQQPNTEIIVSNVYSIIDDTNNKFCIILITDKNKICVGYKFIINAANQIIKILANDFIYRNCKQYNSELEMFNKISFTLIE